MHMQAAKVADLPQLEFGAGHAHKQETDSMKPRGQTSLVHATA